jgi:hypothetical protein
MGGFYGAPALSTVQVAALALIAKGGRWPGRLGRELAGLKCSSSGRYTARTLVGLGLVEVTGKQPSSTGRGPGRKMLALTDEGKKALTLSIEGLRAASEHRQVDLIEVMK